LYRKFPVETVLVRVVTLLEENTSITIFSEQIVNGLMEQNNPEESSVKWTNTLLPYFPQRGVGGGVCIVKIIHTFVWIA
jgi:hypothetical protein